MDKPTDTPLKLAVASMLDALNIPPEERTPTLDDTAERYARALRELTSGYGQDPRAVIGELFDVGGPPPLRRLPSSSIVALRPISFAALCEHHLLPFHGRAKVAYVPHRAEDGRRAVVGLSKLVRLVEMYARRLTMQERIAEDVANALIEFAKADGAMVIIQSRHSCVCNRGVRRSSAEASSLYAVGALAAGAALHVNAVKMLDPTPRSAV